MRLTPESADLRKQTAFPSVGRSHPIQGLIRKGYLRENWLSRCGQGLLLPADPGLEPTHWATLVLRPLDCRAQVDFSAS